MYSVRSWGDGGGQTAEHVIGDILFNGEIMFVICQMDGHRFEAITSEGLDRMWDLHRGLLPETIRQRQVHGALATDSEVSEFLKHVEDPKYVSYYGSEFVTPLDDGLEDAFYLLDRLRESGDTCTCSTASVLDCPNYLEGDEND